MARTAKKISQLDPAPGGPLAGDQFVIERGGVAPNYRLDFAAIVAAVSVGVDATFLDSAANLSDVADVPTARANLGLGSMAVEVVGNWLSKAGNLAGLADLPTSRTNLGLGTANAPSFAGVTLTGPLLSSDGLVGAPAWSFASEPTAGIFRNGANVFQFSIGGVARFQFATSAVGFTIHNSHPLSWGSNGVLTPDTLLWREGNGQLAQRNGGVAQESRLYQSFTDTSNYARGALRFDANGLIIAQEALGTGTFGRVQIQTGGSTRWFWNSTGAFVAAADNTYDIGGTGANRPRNVFVAGGLCLKAVAGAPTDANFTNPTDCMVAIDTTNSRLYARVGGVWKSAALA